MSELSKDLKDFLDFANRLELIHFESDDLGAQSTTKNIIRTLGGKCCFPGCGQVSLSQLELHHIDFLGKKILEKSFICLRNPLDRKLLIPLCFLHHAVVHYTMKDIVRALNRKGKSMRIESLKKEVFDVSLLKFIISHQKGILFVSKTGEVSLTGVGEKRKHAIMAYK